jgi:hypothetical protein
MLMGRNLDILTSDIGDDGDARPTGFAAHAKIISTAHART